MKSTLSAGMKAMMNAASAGAKTIRLRMARGVSIANQNSQSARLKNHSPTRRGQLRQQEDVHECEDGNRPQDDEHGVLANPPGLHRAEGQAGGIRPAGQQVGGEIDDAPIDDQIPQLAERD